MRKISLSKKDKSLSTKTTVILILCAALIICLGVGVFMFLSIHHVWNTKIIPPTCTSKGYNESICKYCKEIKRTHYTESLGHNFGEYVLTEQPQELKFGKKVKTCERCGVTENLKIEPTSTMKKFYYQGDAFNVTSQKIGMGTLTYDYKDISEKYYIKLSYLDSSNKRFVKHDYRITFYKDKDLEEEVKVKLMDSSPASASWELYGNYFDFYNLRDTVTSSLYKQARSSSKSINNKLKPNFAIANDEPVLFFMNDGLVGLFRLSRTADAATLNLKEDQKCAIVRANSNSFQAYFKNETSNKGSWRVKYNYIEDDEWIYDSLNDLINFVIEKDGAEFKSGISKYLDVDGMIDYMITVYNAAAANNVGRAFTLATYDGVVWTPTLYDVDQSFGLDNYGELSMLETALAPTVNEDGTLNPDCSSLLWEKMLNNFYPEISARYNALKTTVFSTANIQNEFQKHKSKVPSSVYKHEKETYSAVDSDTDLKKFIDDFMKTRRSVLDEFFKISTNTTATTQSTSATQTTTKN